MNIGEKIYYLRNKQNLSQDELAEKLNVSRQTISNWETYRAKPDTEKVIALCSIFSVGADYLLNDSITEPLPQISDANELVIAENNNTPQPKRFSPKILIIVISIIGGLAAAMLILALIWLCIGDPGRGTSTLEFTFSPAAFFFILAVICLAAMGTVLFFFYRKK